MKANHVFGRPIPGGDLSAGILTDYQNSLAAKAAKGGLMSRPRIVKPAAV